MTFGGGINPLDGRGAPRTPYCPPDRIVSTCDFCLREGQLCTVYAEGVYCDSCQAVARKEEQTDSSWVAATWVALLIVVAASGVAIIYFFVAPLLP